MAQENVSIQTELKIAKSFLVEAEAKLHVKADVMFSLARRIYRDPVPVTTTFNYGGFFGAPPAGEREKPPLDVGTKNEYRQWLDEAATPVYQDLNAAVERLRNIARQFQAAALIEDGEPKYQASSMLVYGWMLLGDYYFYRCNWGQAAKMYRAAFKLEPSNQELLYRLGLTFVNDGDMGRAENFLARAVELAPESDVAVEAHKQMERMAAVGGDGRKVFRGSTKVLKTLIGIAIGGLLVGLTCVCCGLLGGVGELSDDPEFAAVYMIIFIVVGGLILIIPAVAAAIYYFTKRK
ncbi:MAG: hypothetical protein PVH29_02295 [Candidatus Zixiibacteriota bacterium]|jgi:tetratricopeptide (TPR) repeat protein